jgi:hypothetical protein
VISATRIGNDVAKKSPSGPRASTEISEEGGTKNN